MNAITKPSQARKELVGAWPKLKAPLDFESIVEYCTIHTTNIILPFAVLNQFLLVSN